MEILCTEVRPYPQPTMKAILFWLRIMKEHTLFIRAGLPCEQANLREEAQRFYNIFAELEKGAEHLYSDRDFERFVERVITAAKNIFSFKRHLLNLLVECKIRGGANYSAINRSHITRSIIFCQIAGKNQGGEMKYLADAIISENIFWIRIMADHLKFIRGLLDASEREAIEQAQVLSDKFDQLNLHARDFESILWRSKLNNDFRRFEKNVTEATLRVRDFKASAEELIKQCSVLSLIPPLLADHVRREAEHFLEILEQMGDELADGSAANIVVCEE